MKIAFSTLGCPTWSFEQVLTTARELGYDGIEFRGILDSVDLAGVPEFSPAQIANTRKRLDDAGLQAACLSSSVSVVAATVSEVDRHASVAKAKDYLQMAKAVGAPCVRLFCGGVPDGMDASIAMDKAAEDLRRIGDFGAEVGVYAALETHDAFIRSELLMELVRLANHRWVKVLWDIHHPYRVAGESVAHSMRYLGGSVVHTHVKDSVMSEGGEGYTYVLTGHGDVPIFEAMRALKASGYDGYLCLEWEKRWIPSLDAPEVAFPQYIRQMKTWLAEF